MLLSHDEIILELLEKGVVENSHVDYVNSSSLDVTLADEFLVEKRDGAFKGPIHLGVPGKNSLSMVRMKFSDLTEPVYYLEPDEFILCGTQQIFNLPANISGEYKLKSSMGRIGLEHMNAGWCDAGWNGSCLTLEFKNLTRYHTIALTPGVRIGQVIFFRHEYVHKDFCYAARGRYNNHKTVEGAR